MEPTELEGGPYYTISRASELTGVPIPTLRSWYRRGPDKGGTKAPSLEQQKGDQITYLYTESDLEEIRARAGRREIRGRKHGVRSQDN